MKNNGVDFYTAVPKLHNCAQAVAAGAGREDLVESFAVCGGGKAPGGLCGALHAALALAPESEHENIKACFAEKAGALTCREIKSGTLFPCSECVRVAAELTEKYL